jgi:hypothetical protein
MRINLIVEDCTCSYLGVTDILCHHTEILRHTLTFKGYIATKFCIVVSTVVIGHVTDQDQNQYQ